MTYVCRHMLVAVFLATFSTVVNAQVPAAVTLSNPMVADISLTNVEIHSSFNGTQLMIFGARNVPGELVIVVRGPQSKMRLRRKERIAGMWMHVDQRKYPDVPTFYAIATTEPLDTIAKPSVLQSLGLGSTQLIMASNKNIDPLFDAAFTRIMSQKHWWQEPAAKITYFGESLFKARINLPDTLPGGDYTAEVYLFDRGQLLGLQTIPLLVYKTGIDARITDLAQKKGAAYGIWAVLMALFGGWLAHRLFYRK